MKFFTPLAVAIIFCFCSTCPVLAMPDAVAQKYSQESSRFAESYKKMNVLLQQIKKNLPPGQYAAFQKEQQNWDRNRDIAAMETMREILGISMAERQAIVIERRVQELEKLVSASNQAAIKPTQPQAKTEQQNPKESASASEEKKTIVVKIAKMDKQYIVFTEQDDEYPYSLPIADLKNATQEFRQCIDDGKYKGLVEITAEIWMARYGDTLNIDTASTCIRKSSDASGAQTPQTEKACPDKIIAGPTTESAIFLQSFFASETGLHRAEIRFANGRTEFVTLEKAAPKLKKGSRVFVTYQVEQFWDDEGAGSCEQVTKVKSIKAAQ